MNTTFDFFGGHGLYDGPVSAPLAQDSSPAAAYEGLAATSQDPPAAPGWTPFALPSLDLGDVLLASDDAHHHDTPFDPTVDNIVGDASELSPDQVQRLFADLGELLESGSDIIPDGSDIFGPQDSSSNVRTFEAAGLSASPSEPPLKEPAHVDPNNDAAPLHRPRAGSFGEPLDQLPGVDYFGQLPQDPDPAPQDPDPSAQDPGQMEICPPVYEISDVQMDLQMDEDEDVNEDADEESAAPSVKDEVNKFADLAKAALDHGREYDRLQHEHRVLGTLKSNKLKNKQTKKVKAYIAGLETRLSDTLGRINASADLSNRHIDEAHEVLWDLAKRHYPLPEKLDDFFATTFLGKDVGEATSTNIASRLRQTNYDQQLLRLALDNSPVVNNMLTLVKSVNRGGYLVLDFIRCYFRAIYNEASDEDKYRLRQGYDMAYAELIHAGQSTMSFGEMDVFGGPENDVTGPERDRQVAREGCIMAYFPKSTAIGNDLEYRFIEMRDVRWPILFTSPDYKIGGTMARDATQLGQELARKYVHLYFYCLNTFCCAAMNMDPIFVAYPWGKIDGNTTSVCRITKGIGRPNRMDGGGKSSNSANFKKLIIEAYAPGSTCSSEDQNPRRCRDKVDRIEQQINPESDPDRIYYFAHCLVLASSIQARFGRIPLDIVDEQRELRDKYLLKAATTAAELAVNFTTKYGFPAN